MAEVTFSIENSNVEIQLQSPAANIVGFESEAANPEQRLLVIQAKEKLESDQGLFSFTGTMCRLKNVIVDVSSFGVHPAGKHETHSSKEPAGASHQASDDHQVSDAHDRQHSEILANYQFHCDDTGGLSAISVDVFDVFPGIERMQAMWVTQTSQGAIELSAKHRVLGLD